MDIVVMNFLGVHSDYYHFQVLQNHIIFIILITLEIMEVSLLIGIHLWDQIFNITNLFKINIIKKKSNDYL